MCATEGNLTPKQRMLNAYRGVFNDRPAVAPAFLDMFAARWLGMDMIELRNRIPRHLALKKLFEDFGCEGWGVISPQPQPANVEYHQARVELNNGAYLRRTEIRTPHGTLSSAVQCDRDNPPWAVECAVKDLDADLPAWQYVTFADPESLDCSAMVRAWQDVGDSYLLEAKVGLAFFDTYATDRQGGLEQAVLDFMEHEQLMEDLQARHIDHMVRKARVICTRTPFESLFIGCSWSCLSLIGPKMWRRWDKPVIAAVAEEVHKHGRLLHVHFHGRCRDVLEDFAEMGADCVCPFERGPGGDIDGPAELAEAAGKLAGRVTFNGNVHTIETLVRGNEADVRREVRQIVEAFAGNPRLIIGTGDQVAAETPPQNLRAMIDEARRLSASWRGRADGS